MITPPDALIRVDRIVSGDPPPGERSLAIATMFGLQDTNRDAITIIPPVEIPLPDRGVMLVTGPSGGGKSTLLRLIAREARERGFAVITLDDTPGEDDDRPIIDMVAPDEPVESAAARLAEVGLGDAFVMLRTPPQLSDGQHHRFRLARALERARAANRPVLLIADEFCSTLDRLTAQMLSRHLRRLIDRASREQATFLAICASAHDDILEPLAPDVLVWKGLGDAIEVVQPRQTANACGFAQRLDPDREIVIEPGTIRDHDALSAFHYRSARPATVARVIRATHRAPTIAGRYLAREDEMRVAGVLVLSMPQPACSMRDLATGGRYRDLGRHAAVALAREMRTISRVIVHPQYRGLGLAVRLVRHALATAEPVYTEALAAMGRVHPFFERAGMTRYDCPEHFKRPEHARILAALRAAGIDAHALASTDLMRRAIEKLSARERLWIEHELHEWRRGACFLSKRDAAAPATLDEIIALLRAKALARPVYYLHRRE